MPASSDSARAAAVRRQPAVHREDVLAAARRIAGHVHRTPALTSRTLDAEFGAKLFFKCENLQRMGAFKIRGATNAVRQLPSSVTIVATHSSGNHGAALALAARTAGIDAIIVVPSDARVSKRSAIERYGATVVMCEPTLEARTTTLERVVEETGAMFVPPYDHPHIIAGAGTAALELLQDCGPLDQIWVPVGGGGLAAGTALAADASEVILAEPELPATPRIRWKLASFDLPCPREPSLTDSAPASATSTSTSSSAAAAACCWQPNHPSSTGRIESPK